MDEKIITLKYPITTKDDKGNNVKLETIKVGRIKTKHLKMLPKSFMGEALKAQKEGNTDNVNIEIIDFLPLIAGITNLSENIIDELDFVDLQEILQEVTDLVGELDIPQTGEK